MEGAAMMSKRGFRRAGFCMQALALLATLATGLSAPAPGRAAASIWIKTSSPWSVTGKDDVQQLKYLASGVGYEFEPNSATAEGLRRVGIKTLRCINVDVEGAFDTDGKFVVKSGAPRLEAHLDLCRSLGAVPHVILALNLPVELRVKPEDLPEQYRAGVFGPADWTKFRSYCEAYFEYVLITRGFPHAEFEVGNEPDIAGGLYPFPPKPAMGSRAGYEAAFNLYKNVAAAAVSFEQKHPGVSVRLGGPALAWAFTFKFGDFNWVEHFLRDCGEQQVKLDFIGVHYYGNICSLNGEWAATYPPFTDMLRVTKAAIDEFYPGLPLQITEWGPSYFMDTSDSAAVNANNVGAAWAASFLNTMLFCGVDKALYLITTVLRQQVNGDWLDQWGNEALFLNPVVYGGKTYPKPMYHVFEMVSRLEGHRVEATRGSDTVNCFVSADPAQRKITMLVWNYNNRLGNGDATTPAAPTQVRIRDAGSFFHSKQVQIQTCQINEDTDNIYHMLTTGVAPDEHNTAMAHLPTTTARSPRAR